MSAPTLTVRVLVSPKHGDLLSADGLSLLLGVPVENVRAHQTFNGTMTLPPEWVRSGRRRSNEAQAHGHTDMVSVMAYWAERDHGSHLVVEYVDSSGGGAQ